MNEGKTIHLLLTTNPAFAALVADATGKKRVYPLRAAQGTDFPYCTYTKVNTEYIQCSDRVNLVEKSLIQISFFAKDYEQVEKMDYAARMAMRAADTIFIASRDLFEDDAIAYHRASDYYLNTINT